MGGFSYGYYDRQVLEESVASTSPMCHLSYLNIFYSRYGHDALVKSVSSNWCFVVQETTNT